MNKEIVLQKIKAAVITLDKSAKVILFGSRARGSETANSDWDILVLLNQPKITFKDEQLIRHKIFDIELEIEQPISTFVYSLTDWNTRQSVTPLYKNVQLEGVYL